MPQAHQPAASKVVQPFPDPPKRRRRQGLDPAIAAQMEQAAATREMAAAFREMTERFGPAADTVHGMGDRLDALCKWLRRWGPWMLGSIPPILVAIQAISPEAGRALSALLGGPPS